MLNGYLLESVLRDALTRGDINLGCALRRLICTNKQFYNNYLGIFDEYAQSINQVLGLKTAGGFACLVYARDKKEMLKKTRDDGLVTRLRRQEGYYQTRLLLDCYQKRTIQEKLIVEALFLFISKFAARPFLLSVLPVHTELVDTYENKKSLFVRYLRKVASRSICLEKTIQDYTILFLQICRQEISNQAIKDECFLIWLQLFSCRSNFGKLLEEDSFLREAADFVNSATVRGMLINLSPTRVDRCQPCIKDSLKNDLVLAPLISTRLRGNVNFLNILIEENASSGLKKEIVSALFARYLCPPKEDLLDLKYDPEIHSFIVSIMLERFYVKRKHTTYMPILVEILRKPDCCTQVPVRLAVALAEFRLEHDC